MRSKATNYLYVLEASLCFRNGMVIPLMSEFLEYESGDGEPRKQDCESKAFHRLAARIKQAFPRLPIVLLLDGLYPNGPIMERCRSYHCRTPDFALNSMRLDRLVNEA